MIDPSTQPVGNKLLEKILFYFQQSYTHKLITSGTPFTDGKIVNSKRVQVNINYM